MKKKPFVLSWGRKIFFGSGLVFTLLVGLTYFKSMIFPQNLVEVAYFLVTYIGHYGVIVALLYFLFYYPIVSIFPSYYVSRIWSLTLILSVNFFILIDSYLFSKYRYHLNSFLWKLLLDENAVSYFGLTPLKTILIAAVAFIIFIVFWFRGERIWRSMQSRFSNPVKNWYLVIILLCFVSSNLIHMLAEAKGSQLTRLSNLFPLHFPLTGKKILKQRGIEIGEPSEKNLASKNFYYPRASLTCQTQNPHNILMIVMDNWSVDDLNEEFTPNIRHYTSHGLMFTNHYSGGLNPKDGHFSLLYSIPPVYLPSVLSDSKAPAFISQMSQFKMNKFFFKSKTPDPLISLLSSDAPAPLENIGLHLSSGDPFFMHVYLEAEELSEKDQQVKIIIDQFIQHKLIHNTIIVITAAKGKGSELKTPMVVIWPDHEPGLIEKVTTHYDVIPTIMIEDWRCKNPASDYSFGNNIFSPHKTELHVAGDYESVNILNFMKQTHTVIDDTQGLQIQGPGSQAKKEKDNLPMILKNLEQLTIFYRRK